MADLHYSDSKGFVPMRKPSAQETHEMVSRAIAALITTGYKPEHVRASLQQWLDGRGALPLDANGVGESSPLKQPVAWRREWDGDVSDEGHWLYTDDEQETKDGHQWQSLFLQPPTDEEIRAGLELFKRIRDEGNGGVDSHGEVKHD